MYTWFFFFLSYQHRISQILIKIVWSLLFLFTWGSFCWLVDWSSSLFVKTPHVTMWSEFLQICLIPGNVPSGMSEFQSAPPGRTSSKKNKNEKKHYGSRHRCLGRVLSSVWATTLKWDNWTKNTTAHLPQISLLLYPTQTATHALTGSVCVCVFKSVCSYTHTNRDLTHSTGCQHEPHFLCNMCPPVVVLWHTPLRPTPHRHNTRTNAHTHRQHTRTQCQPAPHSYNPWKVKPH